VVVAIELALERRFRRLLIIGPPGLLYLGWLTFYGSGTEIPPSRIAAVPDQIADQVAATLAGLAGLGPAWGQPLAVLAVVALAFALGRRPLTPRAAAVLALPFLTWTLIGLTRDGVVSSRFLYPNAVFVLLAILELGRGFRFRSAPRAVLLLALVLASMLSNAVALHRAASVNRQVSAQALARLRLAEETNGRVAPSSDNPRDLHRFGHFEIGAYDRVIAEYGRPVP
jgi:hypothetical protein